MKIEDLGYGPFFEEERTKLGLDTFPVARVVSEHRGAYGVRTADGEYLAKVTGKRMFGASSREDYPAVGDWVAIDSISGRNAVIRGILPRVTIIKRIHGDRNRDGDKDKIQIIAANIDIAFVVESVDRDYNLNRFERYFAIAKDGGVKPAIILNKLDLLSQEKLGGTLAELKKRFPDIDVITTSTVNNAGLKELKRYIAKNKTYCFLGSSGVGKSSLINALLGGNTIKTGDISTYSGRGKHVTTARQMYFLENGGIVIDNPGMREVGMTAASEGVDGFFDEIVRLSRGCKYTDCTHTRESGCKVLNAVQTGKLDKKHYANYLGLKKETEYRELSGAERREKDRRFGKFIKRAKKELKDFKNTL